MLRFIFVCMGVVALSVVAIGTQFMTDGVSDAANDVMARNAEAPADTVAVAAEENFTAENLNAIETAAGATAFDPNDTFTGGFTNEAPKALEDDAPAAPVVAAPAIVEQAN